MRDIRVLSTVSVLFVLVAGCGGWRSPWPDAREASTRGAAPDQPERAVIIGIEKYSHLPNIRGARDNAEDWVHYFRRQRGLEATAVQLIDSSEATRERIIDSIERARDALPAKGRLWVVFIGHGSADPESRDGMLLAADARPSLRSFRARSIGRGEVLRLVDSIEHVIILDACFTGNDRDGKPLLDNHMGLIWVEEPDPPQAGVVLTATRATETAGQLNLARRPAFSFLVLGALLGWRDDPDDRVTAAEAVDWANDVVHRVNTHSRPTAQFHGRGDLVLSEGVGASPFDPGTVGPTPAEPIRPWLLMATGAALVGVGAGLHWQNTQIDDALRDQSTDTARYAEQHRALGVTAFGALGAYVVGGALVAWGVTDRVLLEGEVGTWLAVRPTPNGLTLGGWF